MENRHYRVIVVGLGGFGSAALYWLSKHARGAPILGIEQFEVGHHNGGSQDHSRIIRLAYSAPHYTKIAPNMYMAWKSVEDECGVQLVHKTGGIVFGSRDNPHVTNFATAMEEQGIPFDDLTGEEAIKRWPQLNLRPTDRVLYQAEAGIVDPRQANAAHIGLARAHGAQILEKTKVSAIIPVQGTGGRTFRIVTKDKGVFTCDRVVIAAASWVNPLLNGLGYHLPLSTTKEQVTYYATSHLREFAMSRFPVWIAFDGDGEETTGEYYGFPVYGEMGTKAGTHAGGKQVDPDTRDFLPDLDARGKLEDFLSRRIPRSLGPRLYTKTCLYTTPDDDDLILSQLPDFPEISVVIGAGHGYKWASFFGLILSQLALEGKTPFPVEALSITRPSLHLKKVQPYAKAAL